MGTLTNAFAPLRPLSENSDFSSHTPTLKPLLFQQPTSKELEEYVEEVMKAGDRDGNGKFSKDELAVLLSAPQA